MIGQHSTRGFALGRCLALVLFLGPLTAGALATGPATAQSSPPMMLDLTRLGENDPKARRIAVTMTPGLRSGSDLKHDFLRRARDRMVQGKTVPTDLMQALADAGDGVAALHLAQQLEARGNTVPARDVAHYFGIAAATGRVAGLIGLVRTLKRIDPAATNPKRVQRLKEIVLAYAMAGNSVASAAMMEFHLAGHPFGPMPEEIASLATQGRGAGGALIALQLASDLVQTRWDDPTALTRAQSYLRLAVRSDSVRVKLIAGNLLPVLGARIASLGAAPDAAEPDR